MQNFKSVYFADHPGENSKRRNLKLAFGASDADVFQAVSSLTSEEIRGLLGCGSFGELKSLAIAEGTSINSYSVGHLRKAVEQQAFTQVDHTFPKNPGDLILSPIQATYRGGIAEPLHSWFPYLEGYSPDFVKSVLSTFAPAAARVLDPFAGMGTTPLTVASSGGICFYSEINPVLQFVTETKARVLSLTERHRLELAIYLQDLAGSLESSLAESEPDPRLAISYVESFGDSEFFSPDTFDLCLKLRTWLDAVSCENPDAGAVSTVAVLASLVPCSNMIRRGDLRFRKGSEQDSIADDIIVEVSRKLRSIARDITDLRSVNDAPVLITGDAKNLNLIPSLEVDAIVTSPPYLNGTNYYRNTKIELWFLRALMSSKDLTSFRSNAVTAGINDVTVGKNSPPVSQSIEDVVRRLEGRAYDRRIPMMVSSYFADMKQVFDGLLRHVKPSSRLLMDIGDSSYAGIHVDTPAILADLLNEDGWVIDREVTLRQRLSRNGQPLRQVLLVATSPSYIPRRSSVIARPNWEIFKRTLPHQRGDYAKRNWGNPLHSLCSYQGKLKPSLARHLVRAFTNPGDRLLDPFGGVGTIPFEAAFHGVKSWSFDISPVAVPIAAAKLSGVTEYGCKLILNRLEEYIRAVRPTDEERSDAELIRFNGSLPDYYHPKTFDEILSARRFFRENSPFSNETALVFSCLLHILHGNRPYALSRRSHPITPFSPRGRAEYKELTVKLAEKIRRSLSERLPENFLPGSSMFQDATDGWPLEIDQLNAVITSPPFYDSTRFHLANWIRLWFAGWTRSDFDDRPLAFVEERQKRGFDVYEPVIRQARERLNPDGICLFHLGKSRKCDMAWEIAKIARPWFRNAEIFSESVAHCESHGIRDKGTTAEHTYLLLT